MCGPCMMSVYDVSLGSVMHMYVYRCAVLLCIGAAVTVFCLFIMRQILSTSRLNIQGNSAIERQ
jgi:hypothetical protein